MHWLLLAAASASIWAMAMITSPSLSCPPSTSSLSRAAISESSNRCLARHAALSLSVSWEQRAHIEMRGLSEDKTPLHATGSAEAGHRAKRGSGEGGERAQS